MPLRVLTLNVWGLPSVIASHVEARMQLIGDALVELDVDVVAFQEVWTDANRATLVDAARRAGFVNRWHREAARGGSGLLVVSRLPIRAATFHPYTVAGLPQRVTQGDYWGGKGLALLQLTHPEGAFTLLDTHLIAGYGSPENDAARPGARHGAAAVPDRERQIRAGGHQDRRGRAPSDVRDPGLP